MREIKFRFWDKVEKKMYFFTLEELFDALDDDYYHGMRNWTMYIPMQYTGLKDKNGAEIYEGDIIKVEDEIFICRWDKEFPSFEFSNEEENGFEIFVGGAKYDELEIIGNIYENPELLGAK